MAHKELLLVTEVGMSPQREPLPPSSCKVSRLMSEPRASTGPVRAFHPSDKKVRSVRLASESTPPVKALLATLSRRKAVSPLSGVMGPSKPLAPNDRTARFERLPSEPISPLN